MSAICLYFQVHQPLRIKNFSFFDIAQEQSYFDTSLNKSVLNKVADQCYIPTNELLLSLIKKHKRKFKCTFSLSGILIEQLAKHRPDVIESFQALVKTGCVELLGETYYHSLAAFFSTEEFERQIKLHKTIVKKYFGVEPTYFRNTELLFNDEIITVLVKHKYKGIWIEGSENGIGKSNVNRNYYTNIDQNFTLIPRNFPLSDDIAFRFAKENKTLNPDKFTRKVLRLKSEDNSIHLGLDYETFGEHFEAKSGILYFLKNWIDKSIASKKIQFISTSECSNMHPAIKALSISNTTSWADSEKDSSAWLGNDMQRECMEKLYNLRAMVFKLKNKSLIDKWSTLTCSDHFYYMSNKQHADGEVHNYFSPFDSPHTAYIAFINIITDLELKVGAMKIYSPE
jgi:alpha-amylase